MEFDGATNREGMSAPNRFHPRRVRHAGCRLCRHSTRSRRSCERRAGQRSVSEVEKPNDSRSHNHPEVERSHCGGPCRSFEYAGLACRVRIGIEAAGDGTTYDSAGKSIHQDFLLSAVDFAMLVFVLVLVRIVDRKLCVSISCMPISITCHVMECTVFAW